MAHVHEQRLLQQPEVLYRFPPSIYFDKLLLNLANQKEHILAF